MSRDLGEADKMLTVFTRDFGKVSMIAKGTRLLQSKLRGHLNVMARSRLVFVSGKDIFRLTDAEEVINYFAVIKNGRRRIAGRALNLLDRLLQGSSKDEELWRLLVDFLENGMADSAIGSDAAGAARPPSQASDIAGAAETLFGVRALRILGYVNSNHAELEELLTGGGWSLQTFLPFQAELTEIYQQGLHASHL